jgi:hypothetical protein
VLGVNVRRLGYTPIPRIGIRTPGVTKSGVRRVSSQPPPATAAAAPAPGKGVALFLAGEPFVGKSVAAGDEGAASIVTPASQMPLSRGGCYLTFSNDSSRPSTCTLETRLDQIYNVKSAQVRAIGHKQSAGIALSVVLKSGCIRDRASRAVFISIRLGLTPPCSFLTATTVAMHSPSNQ